jgi:hypothetical protein
MFFLIPIPIPHEAPHGTAPLTIETDPVGALVTASYGDVTNMQTVHCTTPCTINIPQAQPFKISVFKAGYTGTIPVQLQWDHSIFSGYSIKPDTLNVTLHKVDDVAPAANSPPKPVPSSAAGPPPQPAPADAAQ